MSSSGSNGSGPDFDLPDEILSVIPSDPYDQLDLARKITSMAIASRVSKLESDTSRLRQKLYEKDRLVFELEEKVLRLERAPQEADSRLKATLDENVRNNILFPARVAIHLRRNLINMLAGFCLESLMKCAKSWPSCLLSYFRIVTNDKGA